MKRFFISSLFFLIGILVINAFIYQIVNKLLYKPYSIELNKVEKYDSFLMADSHGKSVNQADLDKISIFNLSYNSDSYVDIYIKLNYLINNNVKIKNLYLTADEHTLSPYRETGNNNSRSVFFTDYTSYNELYGKQYATYFYETIFIKYFALINTNNSKLVRKYLFSENETPYDEKSFKDLTVKERKRKAESRVKLQFVGNTHSSKMNKYLEKIFMLCRENNISVYGIKFPVSKAYLTSLSNKSYNIDSIFRENKIRVFDLKKVFIENDDYFENQDHLNKKGSQQFSKILKERIK